MPPETRFEKGIRVRGFSLSLETVQASSVELSSGNATTRKLTFLYPASSLGVWNGDARTGKHETSRGTLTPATGKREIELKCRL